MGLRTGCSPTGELPLGMCGSLRNSSRQALPKQGGREGLSLCSLAPLSKAEPGARVNTSTPLDWPLARLTLQGGESPTEMNRAWCRGRRTGYILGLCHYLSPEAGPFPTELRFPAQRLGRMILRVPPSLTFPESIGARASHPLSLVLGYSFTIHLLSIFLGQALYYG